MTPKDLVREFTLLKTDLTSNYFSKESEISRLTELKQSGFTQQQIDIVRNVFDEGLTDALYTVLLGLDGAASIGSVQNNYVIKDEEGNLLTGNGELETYAWEEFHGS